MFLFVGLIGAGIAGCTKDPGPTDSPAKPEKRAEVDKDAKIKEAADRELAAKELAAKELAKKDAADRNEIKPAQPAPLPFVGPQPMPGEPMAIDPPIPMGLPAKKKPTPVVVPVVAAKEKIKDKDKDKTPPKEPANSGSKNPEFKEPTEIGGKSFAYWHKELQATKDPGRREEAIKAILLFGPNKAYEAVPDILSELNKHTAINPRDLSVRVHGVTALTTIFRNKEKVDPKHVEAAYAIFKRYLNDSQVVMKITTVQSIAYLGPISRGAIDDVITMTKDKSTWEVRKAAMQVLALMAAPEAKGAAPHKKGTDAIKAALDRYADDGSPKEISRYVRETAVQALTMVSHGTGKVPVELRTKALTDPAREVRLAALNAIASLKPEIEIKTDLPIWVKGLNKHLDVETDPIIKVWTHGTIMTVLGNPTQLHMEALGKYSKHKDPLVRVQALNVIGLFDEKAKKFVLKDVLYVIAEKDQSPAVMGAAYIALARMQHWDPMLEKMNDKNKGVRLEVLELISNAGPPAKTHVLKAVTDAVGERDTDVADTAIATLVNLHAFETMPMLEKLIADKETPADMKATATEAVKELRRIQDELKKVKKTP